jgi:hypothetical protein
MWEVREKVSSEDMEVCVCEALRRQCRSWEVVSRQVSCSVSRTRIEAKVWMHVNVKSKF